MGCDIHIYVEQQGIDGAWSHVEWPFRNTRWPATGPFDDRDYHVFGFLAGVRNYSAVDPIAEVRGLPDDLSAYVKHEADDCDWHSHSWLSADELTGHDYTRLIEDRRVTREIAPGLRSGAETAEPGGGKQMPLSEFLGEAFLRDVATLSAIQRASGDRPTRVVFWFDN